MTAPNNAYLNLINEFPLRHLRSEKDLDRAIEITDELAVRRSLSRAERDYLDVLVDLIEMYEDEHHAIEPLPDWEILRFLIEQCGKTQMQVARETGIANSTISAVLQKRRELTRRHITTLATFFHVDPGVFLVPNSAAPVFRNTNPR